MAALLHSEGIFVSLLNLLHVYDVDAHPKAGTSSRKTTQTPPTQEVLSALPQTGQLNWPVPVLAVTGAVLVAAGVVLKKRSGQNEK